MAELVKSKGREKKNNLKSRVSPIKIRSKFNKGI